MLVRVLSSLVVLSACSFQAGALSLDAPPAGDASLDGASDASSDAAVDASLPINVVASSNGGILETFTSEYCAPSNPPGDCMPGYWLHTNVHDSAYAMGLNATSRAAGWCSGQKPGNTPEEFVFSFAGGRSAAVERVVVQNWGENLAYYSTHVIVYGQTAGDTAWNVLVDSALATNETPQPFNLASPVVVAKLRVALTDGQNNQYWEVGELEAWGRLQ